MSNFCKVLSTRRRGRCGDRCRSRGRRSLLDATEREGSFEGDGLDVLGVGTPRTDEVTVPDHVTPKDSLPGVVVGDGHANKDDEAVPLTDAPVEAIVVPGLAMAAESLRG